MLITFPNVTHQDQIVGCNLYSLFTTVVMQRVPSLPLLIQEVNEDDEVILMYRFYYHMDLDRKSRNVELLFKQAR